MHFFSVKFFKYKIDTKNRILRNYNTPEQGRSVLGSIKSVLHTDFSVSNRFRLYLSTLKTK